jgi:hypothetical protein
VSKKDYGKNKTKFYLFRALHLNTIHMYFVSSGKIIFV